MLAWSAGCTLFESHKAPAEPLQAAPVKQPTIRSAPVSVSKPSQPRLNLPQQLPPASLVTLENSDDAQTHAQRLLEQTSVKLTHINRAELAASTASIYEQANELINAAERAMAERDYPAASSLAEKASVLTSKLPAPASP